jgi:hypothetical protein
MDAEQMRKRMLDAYGVRVEPQMSEYVVRQFARAGASLASLMVIGGDARTGMPLRLTIDPEKLLGSVETVRT